MSSDQSVILFFQILPIQFSFPEKWEDHKNVRNRPCGFEIYFVLFCQNHSDDCANFCGLFRESELYEKLQSSLFLSRNTTAPWIRQVGLPILLWQRSLFTFYSAHFEFKDLVNATYIIVFWVRSPCRFFLFLSRNTTAPWIRQVGLPISTMTTVIMYKIWVAQLQDTKLVTALLGRITEDFRQMLRRGSLWPNKGSGANTARLLLSVNFIYNNRETVWVWYRGT